MGNPIRNADGFLAGSNDNDITPSAIIEARSTTKGVLDPRVTEAQRDDMTVGAAQNGMRVFVTDGDAPGFYYYDHPNTTWKSIGGGDFIPRGGTLTGFPITGNLEVSNFFQMGIKPNPITEPDNFGAFLGFYGGDGDINFAYAILGVTDGVSQTGSVNTTTTSVTISSSAGVITTNSNPDNGDVGIKIADNLSDRGIQGDAYYGSKQPNDFAQMADVGSAGGPFIPISGNEGQPTTGPIQIGYNKNVFMQSAERINGISFGENIVATNTDLSSGKQTSLIQTPEYFILNAASDARALRGQYYFGASAQNNDFVQKKYVDDAIISGGGGATNLSFVQNSMGLFLHSSTETLEMDALPTATSTPNVRDGLMSGTDKVSFDAAKAVNGIVTSNGSGSFTAATTTGSGLVIALQNSPGFLGAPTAPTASANTNSTQLATTAYADAKVANNLISSTTVAPSKTALNSALALKQDKASWMVLLNSYTLTNQTAPQKMFNVGTSGNGSFQAKANTTYHFVINAGLNSLSTTSGTFSFQFLGSATISSIYAIATGVKNVNTAITTQTTKITANVETTITSFSISPTGRLLIEGVFRSGSAGTIQPAIGLSSASAAVVEAGAFARFVEVGDATFTASSDID